MAQATRTVGGLLVMEVEGDEQVVRAVVEQAFQAGARLESVAAKRETLEDLFVRRAL
jgi:hypothetical protein